MSIGAFRNGRRSARGCSGTSAGRASSSSPSAGWRAFLGLPAFLFFVPSGGWFGVCGFFCSWLVGGVGLVGAHGAAVGFSAAGPGCAAGLLHVCVCQLIS